MIGNDILDGGVGNDKLYGGFGDDILYGGDGHDFVSGISGNNIIIASAGSDILRGGAGVDSFVFKSDSVFDGADTIRKFNVNKDILDFSDVIDGYDSVTESISDFIQITDNGRDSFLAVDTDGGADNFVQIATIKSRTGLTDEDNLEAIGALVV